MDKNRSMTLKDKTALDRLLRRADAIQRHLDEVTRAAREELLSIREQIRALDSKSISVQDVAEPRPSLFDHKPIRAKKEVKTVLIVEKEPKYTRSLARQTQFAGFKSVVATTAEGGLKKAKECHPDLILLDMELTDLDGLRFISEIRRNAESDRIAIIAISALPHLKTRCFDLGCDDFLLKPVRTIDLIKCTRKLLGSVPKTSHPKL